MPGSEFSVNNRGPLTTIFTPPGSCVTETTLLSFRTSNSASGSGSAATTTVTAIFINHHSWGDPACYPPTLVTLNGFTQWKSYYHSPGICPSGYYQACTQSSDPAGISVELNTDTTAVLCCPSSWSCLSGTTTNSHACSSILTSGQTLTSVWVPRVTPTPGSILIIPPIRNYTDWVIDADTSMVVDGLPVLWASTDWVIKSLLGLPFTAPPTTTSTTVAASPTGNLSSALATPTSPTATEVTTSPTVTPTDAPVAGLPTTAKIGIGISIPLVSIALLFLFFFFRRRRQTQPHVTHHEIQSKEGGPQPSPAHKPWSSLNLLRKSDSDIQAFAEADSDNRILPELKGSGSSANQGRHELSSGNDTIQLAVLKGSGSSVSSGHHRLPSKECYELDSGPAGIQTISNRLHSKFSTANPLNQVLNQPLPLPQHHSQDRDNETGTDITTNEGTDVSSPVRSFMSGSTFSPTPEMGSPVVIPRKPVSGVSSRDRPR